MIYTNVHGSDVVPEVPSQEKYQKYVKDLLQKSNKVITPSNYYRGLVIEKYRVKEEKVFVFPSGGVNKDVFYQMSTNHQALEELGAASGTHYIGFVGRLDVGKGWDIFLKAIAELKSKNQFENKKAIIVGSGKDSDSFERLLKELKLEDDVIAFPLLPQEKLRLIYNSIDVFCFPTTRKGESLGLVGLEAMACGTPVIGSKIGGLLDYIIDGHNGFLFNVGDYIDLSNKILAYYKLNEVERNQMSKNALSKANEYEVENIKGTLITIFNKDYKKVQNYS